MSQKDDYPLGSRINYIPKDLEGPVVNYTEDGFALIDFGDYGRVFFRHPEGIIRKVIDET